MQKENRIEYSLLNKSKLPCSLSFEAGIVFGTGSDDLKLAKFKFFTDFALAVEALLAEEALSFLRDIVALLMFLLVLLFKELSRRKTLLL